MWRRNIVSKQVSKYLLVESSDWLGTYGLCKLVQQLESSDASPPLSIVESDANWLKLERSTSLRRVPRGFVSTYFHVPCLCKKCPIELFRWRAHDCSFVHPCGRCQEQRGRQKSHAPKDWARISRSARHGCVLAR